MPVSFSIADSSDGPRKVVIWVTGDLDADTARAVRARLAQAQRHTRSEVILDLTGLTFVDSVGIGSDFDGVPFLPAGMNGAEDLPLVTYEMLRRGYSEIDIRKVLGENLLLLALGLGLGLVAALVSVAPHVAEGAAVPWLRLAAILGVVLVVGLGVASAATAGILRVPVIPALRRE